MDTIEASKLTIIICGKKMQEDCIKELHKNKDLEMGYDGDGEYLIPSDELIKKIKAQMQDREVKSAFV